MLLTKESGTRNQELGTGPAQRGRVRRSLRASDQGLTIVYYGDGKGKTTAALGALLRAAGQGWRCHVIQFIKGSWPSSEREAIPRYLGKLVTIEAGGKGFVGILDDRLPRSEHKKQARKLYRDVLRHFRVWAKDSAIGHGPWGIVNAPTTPRHLTPSTHAKARGPTPTPRLAVLDELLDAVEFGFISQDEVVRLIRGKPPALHLIITGHKKFPRILQAADLVTRMVKEKHPFDRGVLAVRGVDY